MTKDAYCTESIPKRDWIGIDDFVYEEILRPLMKMGFRYPYDFAVKLQIVKLGFDALVKRMLNNG